MQWTPYTKYTEWIILYGYLDPSTMDANLYRMNYEVDNNIQWGNDSQGNPPPYNFKGFKTSNKSAYDLAIEFLRYYERPADPNQPQRGNQAEYWYNFLGGTSLKKKNKWLCAKASKINIRV